MKVTINAKPQQIIDAIEAIHIMAGKAFSEEDEVKSTNLFIVANCLRIDLNNKLMNRMWSKMNEEFKASIPTFRKRLKELEADNPAVKPKRGWAANPTGYKKHKVAE